MQYKVRKSGKEAPLHGDFFYAIPLSDDPEEYSLIYPELSAEGLVSLLLSGRLEIKTFAGCTADVLGDVKQTIEEKLKLFRERLKSKSTGFFTGGVILAVLGLLSFFVPDPIPLLDESFFVLLGGGFAFYGYQLRRKQLADFEESIQGALAANEELEEEEDPLLSNIFQALRYSSEIDSNAGSSDKELEKIGEEAERLRALVDVENLARDRYVDKDELRLTLSVLQKVFPAKKMIKYQSKAETGDKKRKRLLGKLNEQFGLSSNAFDIYTELFSSAIDRS